MQSLRMLGATLIVLGGLALVACGSRKNEPSSFSQTGQAAHPNYAGPVSFPRSLIVIGDGYPRSGDPCRRLGESEATANWLDDSADLVGCPAQVYADALGGKVVGNVEGIIIISVPAPKVGAEAMPGNGAANEKGKAASKDVVQGKDGLEKECLKQVAAQGTQIIGINRIEESGAATTFYVNVRGASAPWRCIVDRGGTIREVAFTGSEGYL